jgi:hypothetical protein
LIAGKPVILTVAYVCAPRYIAVIFPFTVQQYIGIGVNLENLGKLNGGNTVFLYKLGVAFPFGLP